MKKGQTSPMLSKLIILIVMIIAVTILYFFISGQPEKLTEYFKLENNLDIDPATCLKPPKIKVEFKLKDDKIIIDASGTKSPCFEPINYFWEINGKNYTSNNELCENEKCSIINCCEIDNFNFFSENISLYAEGNLSLLMSKTKINVKEDAGL